MERGQRVVCCHSWAFQVVLLGDTNTGKTCLTLRFAEGYYKSRPATIGAFFLTKRLTVHSITCKLLIWDTAGQEQYQKLASTYYQNAAAVIVCYDVSNPRSLVRLRGWIDELQGSASERVLAIAACKCDLEPVPGLQEEAKAVAESVGALYFETSAKDDNGVSEMFHETAEQVLRWQEEAAMGHAPPLSVTLGGTTPNRSLSPQPVVRTTLGTPASPLSMAKDDHATEPEEDGTRSTADDSDPVADKADSVGCEGSLLVCGSEDSRGCCLM